MQGLTPAEPPTPPDPPGAASYFYWEYGERVVAATSDLGVDGTSITWASDIVLDVDFTGGTSKPAYVLARRLI